MCVLGYKHSKLYSHKLIEIYLNKTIIISSILHESLPGGDGRLHEQKTEIKGITGIRNFWTIHVVSCNNESKKVGRDQESLQTSATPDPGYHIGM